MAWDAAELRRMHAQVKRYRKDITIESAEIYDQMINTFENWKVSQDDISWAVLLSLCDIYARKEEILFYHKLEQSRFPPERKDKVWAMYCQDASTYYHSHFDSLRIQFFDQLDKAQKKAESIQKQQFKNKLLLNALSICATILADD